jgi:hypothetical protein
MIAGVSYAKSYVAYVISTPSCADSRPTIVFDIQRRYSRFKVTVGIATSAKSSARAEFSVDLDGRPLVSTNLVYGQKEDVDIAVAGGARLRLTVHSPNECGGHFVWGNGQLLT